MIYLHLLTFFVSYSEFKIKSNRSNVCLQFFKAALYFPKIVCLLYDSGTGIYQPEDYIQVPYTHRNSVFFIYKITENGYFYFHLQQEIRHRWSYKKTLSILSPIFGLFINNLCFARGLGFTLKCAQILEPRYFSQSSHFHTLYEIWFVLYNNVHCLLFRTFFEICLIGYSNTLL